LTRYVVPAAVLVQNALTETVLLHTGKGRYYELNATGAAMLERLRKSGDPERAIASLLEEYAVDEPRLRQDLQRLIADMEQEGLLERQE